MSATSAPEVLTALQDALQDIERRFGSASAVALNSSYLSEDTRIFQAIFNSSDWSGNLRAFALDPVTLQIND